MLVIVVMVVMVFFGRLRLALFEVVVCRLGLGVVFDGVGNSMFCLPGAVRAEQTAGRGCKPPVSVAVCR